MHALYVGDDTLNTTKHLYIKFLFCRYYHSCPNNFRLFKDNWVVKDERELDEFLDALLSLDLVDFSTRGRENSSWQAYAVSNLTFYIYKMVGMSKIGAPGSLPDYISNHKAVISLNKNRRGEVYEDNMCFFRCLAMRLDCTCRSKCRCQHASEITTRRLFDLYVESLPEENKTRLTWQSFKGVGMDDLLRCERLFDIRIVVLRLREIAGPDGTHRNVSGVVRSSPSKSKTILYLNLHSNHFSFIKDIRSYSNAYDCDLCGGMYTIIIMYTILISFNTCIIINFVYC